MIFENQTLVIICFTVIVLALTFLAGFLRKKGVDVDGITRDIVKSIDIAQMLLASATIDKTVKDRTARVLHFTQLATEYVAQTNHVVDEKEKEALARDVIQKMLNAQNIVPTETERKLIEVGVTEGIRETDKNVIPVIKR